MSTEPKDKTVNKSLESSLSDSNAADESYVDNTVEVDQAVTYDPSEPIEDEQSDTTVEKSLDKQENPSFSEDTLESTVDESDTDKKVDQDTSDSEQDSNANGNEQSSDGDSYLDDDEAWSRSDDEILFNDETTVVSQQEEAVVKWDIQGLYDDLGKVRSKRSLKNNPPLLVVSDSTDSTVSFVLTKNLAGNLARHFENTHRAYYGIRPKSELSFKEKMIDAKTGLRENMGKVVIIGGLLLALLVFGIFF